MNLFLTIMALLFPLLAGYGIYGFFLKKFLSLNDVQKTPAHVLRDDVDFEPAGKFYLFGQHVSAIAAAGPIVGPILAGMWFGWLPAALWIVLGGIFIGGVHDLTTLVASVRHQGKSIAEIVKENMSRKTFVLFLIFLWISLMYVITAFTDITAGTFAEPVNGGKVASSSMMYLGLAVLMGFIVQKFKPDLKLLTVIFIPLVMVCIYLGGIFPLKLSAFFGMKASLLWSMLLMGYCFIASVVPVWVLLQPRGYLGGFFLTITVLVSFAGIALGSWNNGLRVEFPAFISWHNPSGLSLFPLLFTTIACGACSGFHALVSSGTTSKQLDKETDAKLVGYGSMLFESAVAIIALGTLMMLGPTELQNFKEPNMIYANGIATFLNTLGINKDFAVSFALLAFATFIYDTLDVATRLGRYILEELLNWRNPWSPYVAAFLTLLLPCFFLVQKAAALQGSSLADWRMFWTVFGSSNQLLAGFVLFTLSLWLYRQKMKFSYVLIPAVFMLVTSMVSLAIIIKPSLRNMLSGKFVLNPLDITAVILMGLSIWLLTDGLRTFTKNAFPLKEKNKNIS